VNKKGQFSIIAALFVAVILIATVIVTYSTIRNSPIHEQPQVLSAIDETNLALKQILGFTIGYYGSVLQVTGNSSYAKMLATNYLHSGLLNIADMHPDWGASFNVKTMDLRAYWFTNASYSIGNLVVTYNLTGLGVYGVTYETLCGLDVKITDSAVGGQVRLEIFKDNSEPLITLGKQNFKFYRYLYASSTWELVNPTTEPIAFANGTYLIDIPPLVDPSSCLIQVEDSRGIIVVVSSFSRYSCTLTWNSASASAQNYVDNTSDVDSSEDKGTHSNFPAQQSFDGVFDTLTEGKTSKNFLAKKGTFTKITTTGTQTITGIGFLPKAIIFWWTRQTSFGELPSISVGYGFATNYGGTFQNRGVAFASDDNADRSNTGRRRSETYSIIILSNGNPTLAAQASITAFNNNSFTLNWQTNDNRADIIHYVALGGEDLANARAGTFSLTTSAGTQDITGVGFQPDFTMFLWTFTENADTGAAHAEVGMGFAASSTKRAALVANSVDDRQNMATWQQQRTDACILLLDPTSGNQYARVDFSQFLNDGFRINKNVAPSSVTSIFYLALKGGNYDVGSFNSPTSAGNQEIKTLGFQPALLMLATQGRQAATGIGSHAEISLGGVTSATERGATWFEDPNGLQVSDNEMETLNTKIVQWRDRTGSNTFALRGSADFDSFLSNGFRLSWTNVESGGRQIIYVAFGGNNYELDLEVQWTNAQYNGTTEELAIYADISGATENLRVDVWDNGTWKNLFANLVNGWNNISVLPYLNGPTFTIRFKGSTESLDGVQDSWRIDATLLKVWPTKDLYQLVQDATVVVELLQNGTMRWLGQNLQLSTQAKPIPPIPVRAIRVNQTINGLNREVPFQIEDWASDYQIPLGLTSNSSVFSSRTMLVFLVNSKVSKVTIWWDGSDMAKQTSYAYTNQYFQGDDPSAGILTNGILALQFGSSFTVTSTVGTSTCTANFMRINNQESTYGSGQAYVIHHGIVRDIVHTEAEWSNGITDCPNVYSHIVLTLPANATYYTYQLRLMFMDSQLDRTINNLCPIKITVSSGQQQTENGTANGCPIVSSSAGLFYNSSTSTWAHHWSQFISGTKGAGIMFTDDANKMLYTFDTSTIKTGALKVDSTAHSIELLPVSGRASVSFKYSKDVTWYGAVVTFDGTRPICEEQGGDKTGLWIIVEYPPLITVTTQS
jgi:hypothetical protein